MKRILFLVAMFAAVTFISCSKEKIAVAKAEEPSQMRSQKTFTQVTKVVKADNTSSEIATAAATLTKQAACDKVTLGIPTFQFVSSGNGYTTMRVTVPWSSQTGGPKSIGFYHDSYYLGMPNSFYVNVTGKDGNAVFLYTAPSFGLLGWAAISYNHPDERDECQAMITN